jgi:hypothetical protein
MKDLAKLKALHQEITNAREQGLLDALMAQRIYAEAKVASENDPRFLESFVHQLIVPKKAWLLEIEGWFEETVQAMTFRPIVSPDKQRNVELTLTQHMHKHPLDLVFEDGHKIEVDIIDPSYPLKTELWRVRLKRHNPNYKIGYAAYELGKSSSIV